MLCNYTSHVVFISYDGDYPNLCSGILTLEIDGEVVKFGYTWHNKGEKVLSPFWRSGGGLMPNYEGAYRGEWVIDVSEIPEKYQKYAWEIDKVFNENVPFGCCGGCI